VLHDAPREPEEASILEKVVERRCFGGHVRAAVQRGARRSAGCATRSRRGYSGGQALRGGGGVRGAPRPSARSSRWMC
jgi:hypothetical protein